MHALLFATRKDRERKAPYDILRTRPVERVGRRTEQCAVLCEDPLGDGRCRAVFDARGDTGYHLPPYALLPLCCSPLPKKHPAVILRRYGCEEHAASAAISPEDPG